MRSTCFFLAVLMLAVGDLAPTFAQDSAIQTAQQQFEQARKLRGRSRINDALQAVESAKRTLDAANQRDTAMMVKVLDELSIVNRILRRLDEAQQASDEARKVCVAVHGEDSVPLGHILYTAAHISSDRGDHVAATEKFRAAIKIFELGGTKNHADLAMSISSLASMHHAQGDVRVAEKAYLNALHYFDAKSNPQAINQPIDCAMLLNEVGSFYNELGDYELAKKYLLDSLMLTRRIFGDRSLSYADSLMSFALLAKKRGKFHDAVVHYRKVLKINQTFRGKNDPTVAQSWHLLGAALGALGEYDEAIECDRKAIELYQQVNRGETPFMATLLNNLAFSHARLGQYDQCVEPLNKSLSLYRRMYGEDHSYIGNVLCTRSMLEAFGGNIPQAIDDMQQSNDIYERVIRVTMHGGSEKAKLNFMRSLEGKTDFGYALHFQFAPDNEQAARFGLTTALQRKGRVMEVLRDNRDELKQLPKADQLLFQQLGDTKAKLSARLLSSAQAFRPTQQREIAQLKARQDQLERHLLTQLTEFGANYVEPNISLVAKHLPRNGVLLEYVKYWDVDLKVPRAARDTIPRRYGVYLLRGDESIEFAALGEAKVIDTKVAQFRAAIAKRSELETQRLAKELYALLIAPLQDHFDDSGKILIAPDSTLNLLPFAALMNDSGKYLIENRDISLLGCGRDLIRLSAKPAKETSPMMIVSNPACDAHLDRNGSVWDRRSRHHKVAQYVGLAGAEVEGKEIKRLFPNAIHVSGTDATEHRIKTLASPRVMHIASHGFFLPRIRRELVLKFANGKTQTIKTFDPLLNEHPLVRCGLMLAGASHLSGGHGDDGIVTALEMSTLDLSGTQLAVLSACETGVGEVHDGEGVFGMRRALALAGARSQVISLWAVDDQATRTLMQKFYQNLKAGQSRSQSLRSAQQSMLGGKYQSPIYWSAFALSGDWRPINL